ncbi:MAG: hypothetical protein N2Z40_07610 [Caldimicrobium sp.]|nr:hypothetical protein [Caldimicrobium sp.]MCX7614062.1 hypothetical protein [Caldimicrobium sp.]MDW8182859.1 hypothetical protein [Caldimicrobium sp.]
MDSYIDFFGKVFISKLDSTNILLGVLIILKRGLSKALGFSIFEFLIILGIILILIRIGVPNIIKISRIYKYNDYVFQVEKLLNYARILSMERSINVAICVTNSSSMLVYNRGYNRSIVCSGEILGRVMIVDDFVELSGGPGAFDPRGLAYTSTSFYVKRKDINSCMKYSLQTLRGYITKEGSCN